ncbi:hypothetical protein TNCV_3412811 [Trichonephila clavipes]|uniref:Uncharacterized protein n=1 Tax=Trichonephila clavipes TaxID=2585209 RepID=A0A8X6V477_TRICX|nr:hypothetical protein TNCV_3412811 [Trichonephila clavipes]
MRIDTLDASYEFITAQRETSRISNGFGISPAGGVLFLIRFLYTGNRNEDFPEKLDISDKDSIVGPDRNKPARLLSSSDE